MSREKPNCERSPVARQSRRAQPDGTRIRADWPLAGSKGTARPGRFCMQAQNFRFSAPLDAKTTGTGAETGGGKGERRRSGQEGLLRRMICFLYGNVDISVGSFCHYASALKRTFRRPTQPSGTRSLEIDSGSYWPVGLAI